MLKTITARYLPASVKAILIRLFNLSKRKILFLKRRIITPKLPRNNDNKVYLNLGCGPVSGVEYINIDVEPYPNIHYIEDITDLSRFDDETVDMVYASHVVEHIPVEKIDKTLKEWKRVLKKGGIFRFAVPDFNALVDIYKKSSNNVMLIRDQVLGQNPPYHNHCSLWNFEHAKKILEQMGFINIRIWSPDTVDHHNFTDRSSRTIKVGEEEILFSLNIEAEKNV